MHKVAHTPSYHSQRTAERSMFSRRWRSRGKVLVNAVSEQDELGGACYDHIQRKPAERSMHR